MPADVPCTRPERISVNPIDDYTWGAAARSVRTGRCCVVVTVHDRDDPGRGTTRYGQLPEGAACLGSAAIPATATSTQWPPEW